MPIKVDLQAENDELHRRLEEAEETLRAIREGDVDAVVIAEPTGERVYTLTSADRPYRLLVEQMQQGAATLDTDGTIFWCNDHLAAALAVPHGKLVGAKLHEFIAASDQSTFDTLLRQGVNGTGHGELRLQRADGTLSPAYLTFNVLPADCGAAVGVLVTDLTVQKHQEQLTAAHEVLRESEARFRIMANVVPALIWVSDVTKACTWFNQWWLDFTGRSMEQLIGDGWTADVHPDDFEHCLNIYKTNFDARRPFEMEYRLKRRDGEYRWVLDKGVPRFDAEGVFTGYIGSCVDFTDRKHAEEALVRSEHRRRTSLESAEIGAWNVDPATNSLESDERFRIIFHGSTAPITYEEAFAAVHPDDRERIREAVAAATRLDNPAPYSEEYRVIHPNGSIRWVLGKGRANFEQTPEGPRLISFDGTVNDITQRKSSESALRSSRERYLALSTASSDVAYGMSADWSMLLPLDGRGLVASNKEPIRDWLSKNIPQEEHANIQKAFATAIANKTLFELEHRVIKPDRSIGWTRSRAVPILDDAGNIVEWFGAASDITDRKRNEEALRASREQYRALFETIDEGFCIIEFFDGPHGPLSDYVHIEANPAYSLNTGIPNIVGQRVRDMVPDEADGWVEIYRNVLLTGTPVRFERELVVTGRHLELAAFRVGPVERRQVAVLFKDITERKRINEALQASEQRFKVVANTAPAMLWITEPNGLCSFLSRGWYAYTGQTEAEGLGTGWLQAVHPDDREQAGRVFFEANAKQQSFEMSHRLRCADGEYRWVIDSGRPRFDETGGFLGYIGSVVDVHERAEAEHELARHRDKLEATVRERTEELEASHRQLRFSERMAALGTLSAGLGHDMGNLLVPIRVRLESLAHSELQQSQRQDVEAIRTSAEYLRKLSAGLRHLALDPAKSAGSDSTELVEWWEETEAMLRNTLPRGVTLDSRVGSEKCWARISRPALTQAVFNLVQNAGDAMRECGGHVTVWTYQSADRVTVGVSDDGPGMTAEVKARCMEPFFTTKARGISTGMGLALVYGFVADAGGDVQINSEPGQGTTFILSFRKGSAPLRPAEITANSNTAFIEVTNARLRALVTSELHSLSIDVMHRGDERTPDLLVLDDVSNLNTKHKSSAVVLLATLSPEKAGVVAIGERPSPKLIKEAIIKAIGGLQGAP